MLVVVISIFGLIVAAVGVAYARKQATPPKRVLRVDASPPVPLIATGPAAEIGIEVKRDGLALVDPSLITLTLDSDGDYDIARTAFDDGKPVAVDLGVPIVELLQRKGITASFVGSTLYLGPDLIKKGSRASLLVLVDGHPNLDSVAAQMATSLIDVMVATSSQSALAKRRGLAGVTTVIGVAFLIAPVAFEAWALGNSRNASVSAEPDHGTAGSQVRLVGDRFADYEVVEFDGDYTSTNGEGRDLTIKPTQADADGRWEVTFTMPTDAAAGEVSITADGSKYSVEFIDFDVTR